MALVTISDEKLDEILIEVGIPVLDITDLPYSPDQINKSFIYPAMREYFKYFPIETEVAYPIGNDFKIDFPDANTFSVVDARLITNVASGGHTSDPFINSLNVLSVGKSSGRYGTRYNYGLTKTYYSARAAMKATINSQTAFKFKVDKNKRVLKGFSNITGTVAVTWASISLNYDDIPLDFEQDVKHLAASNILQGWGGLISMQSSDSSNDLNADYFLERSKELKEEAMTKFKNYSKITVLRG